MNYKTKLNIKSICLFEIMTNTSFFKFNEENVLDLVYAVIVTNNDFDYSIETFKNVIEKNKKFAVMIGKICEKIYNQATQIKFNSTKQNKQEKEKEEKITVSDLASSLIILHGMDAHYVMYEMDIWEIEKLLELAEQKKKAEMIENRFWAYIQVSPYLPKNIKSPEDLVKFDWEKETRQQRALKDLEDKQDKILATFDLWEETQS